MVEPYQYLTLEVYPLRFDIKHRQDMWFWYTVISFITVNSLIYKNIYKSIEVTFYSQYLYIISFKIPEYLSVGSK